jgi:hypothetical protein
MQLQLLLAAIAALLRSREQRDVADYLELSGTLFTRFQQGRTEVAAEMEALRLEIEDMVRAGRGPSPGERQAVSDRRAELSRQIQDLDDPPIG